MATGAALFLAAMGHGIDDGSASGAAGGAGAGAGAGAGRRGRTRSADARNPKDLILGRRHGPDGHLGALSSLPSPLSSPAAVRWRIGAVKGLKKADPWEAHHLWERPAHRAIRHLYDPVEDKWSTTDALVKIDSDSFAKGAIRRCFRAKMLNPSEPGDLGFSEVELLPITIIPGIGRSTAHRVCSTLRIRNSIGALLTKVVEDYTGTVSAVNSIVHPSSPGVHKGVREHIDSLLALHSQEPQVWRHARNIVVKEYLDGEPHRDAMFADLKLQMIAKHWATMFNHCEPPKKVDIIAAELLEMVDMPGKPLFAAESFMEGEYIKYNSNAGYVEDSMHRMTPQAFSHFTFEASQGQLMVVDIQGVGDLYTDPQIHTADQAEFGDSNLGINGFALFFHSHACSPLCRLLGLEPFSVTKGEAEALLPLAPSTSTPILRSDPTIMPGYGVPVRGHHDEGADLTDMPPQAILALASAKSRSIDVKGRRLPLRGKAAVALTSIAARRRRIRKGGTSVGTTSNVPNTIAATHLAIAKYYGMGRFDEDHVPDLKTGLYHLSVAANLGSADAQLALVNIYSGAYQDILPEADRVAGENPREMVRVLRMAAKQKVRTALEMMAAYAEGGLAADDGSTLVPVDWQLAVEMLLAASLTEKSADDLCQENYQLQAKAAELLAKGGHGLDKDLVTAAELVQQAAEGAGGAGDFMQSGRLLVWHEELMSQLEPDE